MKKIIIFPILFVLAFGVIFNIASATNESSVAKTTPSVRNKNSKTYLPFWKEFFSEFDKGNYLGALVKVKRGTNMIPQTEKPALAYYTALCYHNLGYTDLAVQKYNEAISLSENSVVPTDIVYYSNQAIACINNPKSEGCTGKKLEPVYSEMEVAQQARIKQLEEEVADMDKKLHPVKPVVEDDITLFIKSKQKIHPSALDRITTERMERKLQASEYAKKQQELANPAN